MKTILFFSALFIYAQVCGQSKVKEWDTEWSRKTKGKLKLLKTGKLSSGLSTFYYKSNKSVFSVEQRELFKTNRHTDSTASFSANFNNDTLFRVAIWGSIPKKKYRGGIFYLNGDKILDQDIRGEFYISEISKIIERAYQLLAQAKALISAKE